MAEETGGKPDNSGAESGGLGVGSGADNAGGAGQSGQSGGADNAQGADKGQQSADGNAGKSGGAGGDAGNSGAGQQSGEAGKGGGQAQDIEFELPDGYSISDENLSALRQYASDYGIDKAGAQELMDFHVSVLEQQQEAQLAGWEKMKSDWAEQSRNDKELQDNAGKIDQALSLAKQGVESLGGKELLEVLNMTGVGSHPAIIKAFKAVGENIQSGKIVSGSGGSQASEIERNLAEAFG